jgi:hypothetical protein
MWISKMHLHSIYRMAITIISVKSLSAEASLKDRYRPEAHRARCNFTALLGLKINKE